MDILVINGPNLNMLGIREPDIYGRETYNSLVEKIEGYATDKNIGIRCYQSNHVGDLVYIIQFAYGLYDGIVINPGAYTHTSIAILDALKAVNIPTVEVHITDVNNREEYRKISFVREFAIKTVSGKGFNGYLEAMDILIENNK